MARYVFPAFEVTDMPLNAITKACNTLRLRMNSYIAMLIDAVLLPCRRSTDAGLFSNGAHEYVCSFRTESVGTPTGSEEAADRMVPKQPLHFGPDPRFPGRINYNLRKLSELPHHLLESRMISELKSSVRTHCTRNHFNSIFYRANFYSQDGCSIAILHPSWL